MKSVRLIGFFVFGGVWEGAIGKGMGQVLLVYLFVYIQTFPLYSSLNLNYNYDGVLVMFSTTKKICV